MMMCIIIILIFYYFSEWVDHNSQNFVRQIQKKLKIIVCAVAEEEESKQSVLEPTRRSLKPMCPITSVHSLSFTSLF